MFTIQIAFTIRVYLNNWKCQARMQLNGAPSPYTTSPENRSIHRKTRTLNDVTFSIYTFHQTMLQ